MAMWGREVVEKAFFVDPDIAKAETLPAYAFEDPDVLSLELSTLFAKTWLLVPEKTAENSPSRIDFMHGTRWLRPLVLGGVLFVLSMAGGLTRMEDFFPRLGLRMLRTFLGRRIIW